MEPMASTSSRRVERNFSMGGSIYGTHFKQDKFPIKRSAYWKPNYYKQQMYLENVALLRLNLSCIVNLLILLFQQIIVYIRKPKI